MSRTPCTAVYTGSFDPITLGHLHIIRRAAPLFDQLVIGIGINADKKSLFDPEQRVKLVSGVTSELDNVSVELFTGLAVDFVRSLHARDGTRHSTAHGHRRRIHHDDGQSTTCARHRNGILHGGRALCACQQFAIETDRGAE